MEVISQQQSKNETDGVSSSTLIWENRFKELCDYKRKHGDCLVTQSHLLQISGGYRRLGMWVALQRRRQSANRLPQDQFKALDDLGFVWSVRKKSTSSSEPVWYSHLQQLKKYKKKHGDCLVPKEYPNIGNWVHKQRVYYKAMQKCKSSPMTLERAKALDDIGFIWDLQTHIDEGVTAEVISSSSVSSTTTATTRSAASDSTADPSESLAASEGAVDQESFDVETAGHSVVMNGISESHMDYTSEIAAFEETATTRTGAGDNTAAPTESLAASEGAVGQESFDVENAEQAVIMNDDSESHMHYMLEIATLKAEIAVVSTNVIEMKAESNRVNSDIAEIKFDIAGVKSDIAEMKNLLQSFVRNI
mmetsp:Transcript_19164/g.27278  ORF Transcript_19164/g.27278 Transcript_19164/m.27278 type:complete len:363 (+) Transcript_19164:29-1117(+)